MSKRNFLVWVSTKHGECKAELFGANRLFDVAIHDYGPWMVDPANFGRAEYWIPSHGTEKLETAGVNIQSIPPYDYYAFLDDDLEISTHDLNALFRFGDTYGLDLFQPALSPDSVGSWPHLFKQSGVVGALATDMVEVMCPFFSRAALEKCLWSFTLNQSGWGLDCCIWPKLVQAHVINDITIRHGRAFRTPAARVGRNGLSAWQELEIIKKINYDGASPW